MGPTVLEMIKRANEKLLRLDPDYAAHAKRNRHTGTHTRKRTGQPKADHFGQTFGVDTFKAHLYAGDSLLEDLLAADAGTSRRYKRVVHNGRELKISQCSAETGLKIGTIGYRLRAKHLSLQNVLRPELGGRWNPRKYEFNGRSETVREWAKISAINLHTLHTRLRAGWTIEAALTIAPGSVMGDPRRTGGWLRALSAGSGTSGGASRDTEAKQDFFLEAAE